MHFLLNLLVNMIPLQTMVIDQNDNPPEGFNRVITKRGNFVITSRVKFVVTKA